MPASERLYADRFQRKIEMSAPEDDPKIVVRRTLNSFNSYFMMYEWGRAETARAYLANYTLPFLTDAYAGSVLLSIIGSSYHVDDYEGIKKYLPYFPESSNITDRAIESTDLASVIFSQMPEFTNYSLLPKGFSRKGVLRPPALSELPDRIKGIMDVTKDFADGKMRPNTTMSLIRLNSDLFTTFSFFDTAAKLPQILPGRAAEPSSI